MSLQNQKYLRMLIPGLLLYGVLILFCWTTDWCSFTIPQSWEEVSKLLVAMILGVLYNYTPARKIANKSFFDQINKQICTKLTSPFAETLPSALTLPWSKIRLIYYHFIDKDESLRVKSEIIRWNGLFWTSAADLRAVGVIALLLFSAALVCDFHNIHTDFESDRAGYPLLGITVLMLSSVFASKALTKRHLDLCDEQCDYILLHSREELKDLLQKSVAA